MIKVTGLYKSFGEVQVLKGVDMEVGAAEVVSLTGPSGAGKTSLLQIIGSLDKADSGLVEVGGINIKDLQGTSLHRFRNEKIGFVFQFHHLLPEFTALENVLMPAWIGKKDKIEAEKRASDLLSFLDLSSRIHHKPGELSGGERQRVAVARALINRPAILLADEPSGNLDSENAKKLHRLFFSLRDEFGQSSLIVTHNQELADYSDRKWVLKDGKML